MYNEEPNFVLYKKMQQEQKVYTSWLLSQSPQEILNLAYEYVLRDNIMYNMEIYDLSDEQAKALLDFSEPLKEITRHYLQSENSYMDIIQECIESTANDHIRAQENALRMLPVYVASREYAKEHGEEDIHRTSFEANVACCNAIGEEIARCYQENSLDTVLAVHSVVDRFGLERTKFVIAATIQDKDWDGRISDENKQWAKTIEIPQDETPWNTKRYRQFVVNAAHPGLVDLFANRLRKELELQKGMNATIKHKEVER